MASRMRFAAWGLLLAAAACSTTSAQQAFYTYTSGPGGDGFVWDDPLIAGVNNLGNGNQFITPDGIYHYNYSGNISFFDDNHQAAGNSGLVSGDAWWGNPLDGGDGQVGIYLDDFSTSVETVSFDFSWALAGQDAPSELYIEVGDYQVNEGEGAYTSVYVDLDQSFNAGGAFGGFQGAAGTVTLDIADLVGDSSETPFTTISEFYFYLDDVVTVGGTGEFAIDNLSVDEGGASADNSNIFPYSTFSGGPIGGLSTNRLKDSAFDTTVQFDVKNDGIDDTRFTATLDGTSNPNFVVGTPATNAPILAGEVVNTGPVATLSSSLPSGLYESSVTVSNDLNGVDPDESIPYNVEIYDPPELSDNSGFLVQVDNDPQINISNEPAGPHAGALRAGAEVAARSATGPFSVDGFLVDQFVAPGETRDATVHFDRFGKLSASYLGTFTVDLTMNSSGGGFLNGAEPVPSVEWDLLYSLSDTNTDSANLGLSETYNQKVGVNKLTTAATLIDGESPTTQTVSMQVTTNPEQGGASTATLATNVVDLDFSSSSGLYVLQFTYLDQAVPLHLDEADLRLLVFDTANDEWIEAIDANSDGGVGATPFSGSYADYLATTGGGALDGADLSAFGVDAVNDTVWAVLNHASAFAAGVLGAAPIVAGDYNNDGIINLGDYTVWRDNLGAPADTLPNDPHSSAIGTEQYTTWKLAYSLSPPAAAGQQVPEPSSIALVAMALAFASQRGARRDG